MNVVLIVIDSLRAQSLRSHGDDGAPPSFFDELDRQSVCFRRAFATECWTLPSHLSMFTGLMPSEHGAHFQGMAYRGTQPTIAELLAADGVHTEVVTRNPQFDGTAPGVTRGFMVNTRPLASAGAAAMPLAILFAMQKPRLRRMVAAGGWYSLLQRQNARFVTAMARVALPADDLVLDHLITRMAEHRARRERFFLFANLFDVHSPYGGTHRSFFSSLSSWEGCKENLAMRDLCRIQSHEYLRGGFEIAAWSRAALLARYRRAIVFMAEKLAAFFAAARGAGLLDDTMVIVTADHGEAFGEHALYYHDASVYNVHLHVPLWIHHPDLAPATIDDTVSTRELFGLIRTVALDGRIAGTMLDDDARRRASVALAEHFHYPRVAEILPQYAQNIAAALVGRRKAIVRRDGVQLLDLDLDPRETAPEPASVSAFEELCRRDGAPSATIRIATDHLRRWEVSAAAA